MTCFDPLARFPDSPLCTASAAHLARLSTASMRNHCQRTFRFAVALGAKAELRPDLEVLYISSLLHDLGLEPGFAEQDGDFEDVGGRAARDFLLGRGAREELATSVQTAIALHTQLATADDPIPEHALLHMGAMVDVVGMRIEDIPEETVHAILEQHPRLGCKQLLLDALSRQVERKPDSRIAAAFEQFQLPELIRSAPFEE